ncbi:MAG: hypothetical protein ACKV0T_02155, partial [Planctomycetales bacterium]
VNATELVATGWNLTGRLTSYGTRIRWSNGAIWDMVPALQMDSVNNFYGRPNRVEQQGATFFFINRLGQTSGGRFVGQNAIIGTDWGPMPGVLVDHHIDWANDTHWYQQDLSAPNPHLAGLWDVNGQNTRILQSNSELTFVNRFGQNSRGYFISPTEVIATDWGDARGILSGKTLTWPVNGIVWTALPTLGGAYVNATGEGVGVNHLERSLTFTDERGSVSHGILISATQFQETDGAQRNGTISGDTLKWGADGPEWSRLPELHGNWSVVGSDAPTFIEQSLQSLLFVNDIGQLYRGERLNRIQALLSPLGVANPPVANVAVIGDDHLDFGNELSWRKSQLNALDAVFSDANSWPFM